MPTELYGFGRRFEIPKFNCFITAARNEALAVWRKSRSDHVGTVSLERTQQAAAFRIPQFRRLPSGGDDNFFTVRRKSRRSDALTQLDPKQTLAVGRVPDDGGPILAAGNNAVTVWRKADRLKMIRVPLE